MSSKRARWAWFGLSAIVVAVPCLLAVYPPSVDLPQHVAQVRLLGEALHDPHGLYRIMWLTPYSAITVLLGFVWLLVGPLHTAQVGLLLLGWLWAASMHWLAARRERPPEAAALASLLFLGFAAYHGFASFLLGWPVFVCWIEHTTRPPTQPARDAWPLFALSALLYVCHGLWFAVAVGWLVLVDLWRRPPLKLIARQTLAVAPLLILGIAWWFTLDKTGWDHPLSWMHTPWARLSPAWFVRATFGGLPGVTEPLALGAIGLWFGFACWQNRTRLLETSDPALLCAAGVLLVGAVVMPTSFSSLTFAAERFAGPGLALLTLALPRLDPIPSAVRSAVVVVVLIFSGLVAFQWKLFDETELTGFDESVRALPAGSRVIGLDFLRTSELVLGHPFTHQVAYAQVVKGGELAYSFAEGPEKLVLYRDSQRKKWTRGVEYYSERVRPDDLKYFDYVLLAAGEDDQAAVAVRLPMTPVTHEGLWRLYKVR